MFLKRVVVTGQRPFLFSGFLYFCIGNQPLTTLSGTSSSKSCIFTLLMKLLASFIPPFAQLLLPVNYYIPG